MNSAMNDPRPTPQGQGADGGNPRSRDGERLRLEHESTLSLDWETQHGSGSEAAGVDEVLRARDANAAQSGDDAADELGPEPDIGLDRTMADPANATMRGIESPLIAPKGTSGGTAAADGARGAQRPSDEGFRFSGASMSFGQLVVVETRDFPTDELGGLSGDDMDASATGSQPSKGAAILLVALGLVLAVAGAVLLVL